MFQLSESEQSCLLKIARDSVHAELAGSAPQLPVVCVGILNESHGAFVSLHKRRELRGCIGNIHPETALYRTVSICAISAAFGDPRFEPLKERELPDISFEISVLSQMEKVTDIARIRVGRDGLFISKRTAQGLLLPQIATAYGWDRERFLAETCKKAGLRPAEWQDGAIIFRFSAHVFGEHREAGQRQ